MQRRVLGLLVLSATAALAKTDIRDCVSSATGGRLVWYVPDTGELCEQLDCGGGRAPPKTTVPGCPLYEGTETYSPKYLPGFAAEATSTDEDSAYATDTIGNSGSGAGDSIITPTNTVSSTPTTAAETESGASGDNATPSPSNKSKALETGTGILTATEAASTDALVTAPPGPAATTAPSDGASSSSDSEDSSSDESPSDSAADAGRNGSGSVPEAAAATVGPKALGIIVAAFGLVAGVVFA